MVSDVKLGATSNPGPTRNVGIGSPATLRFPRAKWFGTAHYENGKVLLSHQANGVQVFVRYRETTAFIEVFG
jgi:hypothetical protein